MENPSPEAARLRENRHWLRQIDSALRAGWEAAGSLREAVGLVDLYWHPADASPALNLAVPRRNTALVPVGDVCAGLNRLRAQGREPRFQYIEGLFPAHYAAQLRAAGLVEISRVPVAAFTTEAEQSAHIDQDHEAVWVIFGLPDR
jgi:hypothetical protein